MKKYIKYLMVLVAMALCFMPVSAMAEQSNDGQSGDYTYYDLGNEIAITDYNGSDSNLSLPETIMGKKVTEIWDNAFEDCASLVNVTIPANINYVGSYAFSGCENLKSVVLNGSVIMSDNIFSGCRNLEKVILPDGLTHIFEGTFEQCTKLKYVYIPDSVTTIMDSAFSDESKDVVIYCSKGSAAYNYAVKEGLSCSYSDGDKIDIANEDTSVSVDGLSDIKYVIDENVYLAVTVDGKKLIKDVDYTLSYLSNSYYEDDDDHFFVLGDIKGTVVIKGIGNYCGILAKTISGVCEEKYITDADGNMILSSYNKDSANIVIPDTVCGRTVVGIGDSAFMDCKASSISLPATIQSIGAQAFEWCDKLESITIPSGVKSICERAFAGCHALKSISISDGVETIGQEAFIGCAALKMISIPESVRSIGSEAFSNCPSVTNLTVDSRNPVYDSRNNCKAIIETATNTLVSGCKATVIPSDVTAIGDSAFYLCSGLKKVTLPRNLKSIGSLAFCGCDQITTLSIPSGVTYIGYGAFMDCSKLTSLVIPDGVTKLNGRTFEGCKSLTNIKLSKNITRMKNMEFNDCESLKQIVLPAKLREIWTGVFWNCKSLTNINIPASVTDIREDLFAGCDSLVKITVDKKNKKYDSRNNCNAIIEKTSSKLVTACNKTVIPGNVKIIGSWSFNGLNKLENIVIPASVTTIETSAISNCANLKKLVIPYSVKKIGSTAPGDYDYNFADMPKLTIYTRKYSTAYNVAVKKKLKYSLITTDLTAKASGTAVTGITNKQFTGSRVTQNGIVVKAYGRTLKAGVDYRITYKNNVNAGIAQVLITGKGGYKGTVVKTFKIVIPKNKVYTVGALKYRVTNASTNGAGTVTLTGTTLTKANKKFTALGVKNTVLIGGVRFKVTAIGANAFNGYTHISAVSIASGVKVIGDKAFYGCKALKEIKLGDTVKAAGSQAFAGIASNVTVTTSAAKVSGYKTLLRKAGMPAKAVYKTR